eukprot:CAMPEP_0170567506 /NCGR_PEP_ID=MMETSP0211-20121228/80525_1 /TAXON_ID=311385 /ORGANISM="Pseudokeronopsis sp., Strain OXSARD2" /LENGTH=127 /DNA_ID=CAMNT_0010888983 /DNA_START=766 /DNA_END=1149 /DNA_ORIENTATION=+
MSSYSHKFYQLQQMGECKLEFGQFLREAGQKRQSIFINSLALEYYNLTYKVQADNNFKDVSTEFVVNEDLLKELVQRYVHLNELIKAEKLENVHNWKAIIDGNTLCDLYEVKPGKILKSLLEEQMNF